MCWRFLRFAFWPPALPGQTPEVGVAAVRELRSTAFPSVPVSNFLFVHKYIGNEKSPAAREVEILAGHADARKSLQKIPIGQG